MRILKFQGKLIEETSHTSGVKNVFFKYLRDEDKDKCPHCQKPIEVEHSIVENCPNWNSEIKKVDTLEI
jgi:Zn finger protein HypA/HybF involved in hydrogenase expression